jgi:AI-2E family transporter
MSDLIVSARPVADNDDAASAAPAELASILTLQTGLAVIAALYVAREVIVPVTLAIMLSFVLTPLVDLLRAAKLGRVPSVLLAVLLALTVLLAMGGVIGSQLAQLATKIPEYTNTIEQKIDSVRAATVDRVSALLDRLRHSTTTPPNDGSKPQATPQKRDEAQYPSPLVSVRGLLDSRESLVIHCICGDSGETFDVDGQESSEVRSRSLEISE